MTRLDAHARFAVMKDRSFLPEGDGLGLYFPAVATSLADASGWLDDCETDDDLRAAAEQGQALVSSDVTSPEAIAEAANAVIVEVMEWAEQQGATCSDDS